MKERIALATYSARHVLNEGDVGWTKLVDFMVEKSISNVEINNVFVEPENFSKRVQLFTDKEITPIQLTIDGNNFFQSKDAKRKNQFQFMKKWVDLAHAEGIPFIRANMGHSGGFLGKLLGRGTIESLEATFRPILEYIENLDMKFVFENHWGLSSNIDFQLAVKERFPTPSFGYLLDCGNYRPHDIVYENIEKLKDSILMVHVKTKDFDAENSETNLDYERILGQLREIGYDGYLSIEFEGNLPDFEGIEKTLAMLNKFL